MVAVTTFRITTQSPKGEISIVVGESNKKILENNIIVKSKAKLGSKLSLTDKFTFQKHTNTVSVIDIAKSYLQADGEYYYSGYVKNALNGRKKYANGYTSFTWDVGAKIYFVAASNGILTSSCKIDHPNQFWPIPNPISNIKVRIQKNDGEMRNTMLIFHIKTL